jgi:hypothetical protein
MKMQLFFGLVKYTSVLLFEASPYAPMANAFMFHPSSAAGIETITVRTIRKCTDIWLKVL